MPLVGNQAHLVVGEQDYVHDHMRYYNELGRLTESTYLTLSSPHSAALNACMNFAFLSVVWHTK